MANPFKTFLNALFGKEDNINDEEITKAEQAGTRAAEKVANRLVVKKVAVDTKTATAKANAKGKSSKEEREKE